MVEQMFNITRFSYTPSIGKYCPKQQHQVQHLASEMQRGTNERIRIGFNETDSTELDQRLCIRFYLKLKIVGETGAAVPIGEVGEIYLRGWPLYSALHPTTKSEMRRDSRHWFHTGDIGKMDESGHVTIIGRKSDSIRYKKLGDVVYPAVIESVATRYHNTREAVVLGFEDDLRGISIVACVILEHDTKEARKETEEYLAFELRELDRPDRVIFLQDFPRVGARQKVARTKLQEQIRSLLAKESK